MQVTPHYTKPMMNLIQQIRLHVPAEYKHKVKFANPDLLTELVHYYHISNDIIVKTLIKGLIELAGEPWVLYVSPSRMNRPNKLVKKSKETRYREKMAAGGN